MSLSTNNPVILKPIECMLIEPKVKKIKATIRAQCAICMEPVKFPLSHGCCTFKCCRSCYNQLSVEQKQKCSGCRTDTGIDALNTNLEEHYYEHVDLLHRLNSRIESDAEIINEQYSNLCQLHSRIDRDAERHRDQCARIDRDAESHRDQCARIDSLIIADRDQCARITSLSISLDEKTIECAQLSSMLDANVANIEDMFHDALEVQ